MGGDTFWRLEGLGGSCLTITIQICWERKNKFKSLTNLLKDVE